MTSTRSFFAKLLLTAAVLVAMLPQPSFALDKAGIVAAMSAKYKGVTSIKATVVQTQRNELFGDESVTGELLVKRPAKVRWAFGADKLFVTDGTKLWIYTAQDKQVIEYDDVASNRASAEQMLTSLDKIDEKFNVTVVTSDATGHVIDLAPRGSDVNFKKVRLTLGADLMLKTVVITDSFDNVTEMAFSAVQLNVAADDAQFTFSVPTGVSVIKGN